MFIYMLLHLKPVDDVKWTKLENFVKQNVFIL